MSIYFLGILIFTLEFFLPCWTKNIWDFRGIYVTSAELSTLVENPVLRQLEHHFRDKHTKFSALHDYLKALPSLHGGGLFN